MDAQTNQDAGTDASIESDGGVAMDATTGVDASQQNTAPSAPVVRVSPPEPSDADSLTCDIEVPSVDPEGDGISYSYEWRRDGVLVAESSNTVTSSLTAPGQQWTCAVTPSDGRLDGPQAASATVQVACGYLDFDGSGDHVVMPNIDLGSDFTVEMSLRFDALMATPQSTYFFTQNNSDASSNSCGQYNCLLFSAQDQGIWQLRWHNEPEANETRWDASGYNAVGVWMHVAVTFNSTTRERRLFVDGQQRAASTAVSAFLSSAAVATYLGRPHGPIYAGLDGQVRWFRISDSVRYTGDFTPAYATLPDDNSLVLYLFGDGSGATLTDASGNGNHGTIVGATWVSPGACP